MTFEQFLSECQVEGAELFMLRNANPHDPRLLPETKREILTNGPWRVKLISIRNKLGRSEGHQADGVGHTPAEAFTQALYNWRNPYIFVPTPRRGSLQLQLTLEDLDL